MEHARKMVLMDPRLLDTLRAQPPPPPPPSTDTLGKKVQALDEEMTILDRKDLDDRTKVTLYNQVLQLYNALSDKYVKEPVRVVSLNESMSAAAPSGSGTGVESEPVVGGTVGAPSSGIEADVVETIPNTMQVKAKRLMEHLKRDIAWTARGELIHEGVLIVGSNVVDLVNDMLRKRKTDPIRWQPFARQLRTGNASRRAYIRQATTTATPSRRTRAGASSVRISLSWTPLARRRSRMEHSMPTPSSERRQRHKTLTSLTSWEDF